MLKLFKNCFHTTNNCIILATPLIIFLSIISWYISYANNTAETLFQKIFAEITLFVLVCGFLSSWLYMVKKTLQFSKKVYVFDKDRLNAIISLFGALPKGIGKLILPIIGFISSYIIFYIILLSIFTCIITTVKSSFIMWNILWVIGGITISFFTLLWLPEIVYSKKNFITSFISAIIKLFSTLKNSIILYAYILFLIVAIFIINTTLLLHPIISFFTLMIFYYLLVYIVVLLFTYYEQTFLNEA